MRWNWPNIAYSSKGGEMRLEKVLAHVKAIRAPAGKPAATSPFNGKWTNQYGSTADITVRGSAVSGTYTSKVSSTGASLSGPIAGHAVEDTISFCVLWPTTPGSVTSWVGQIVDVDGVPTLKTLWHLVVNLPDPEEPTELWEAIYAGADEFCQ